MLSHKLFIAFLVLSAAGRVIAADALPMDALRAKFPHGIPWKVDVINADGKSRGELEMLKAPVGVSRARINDNLCWISG